MTPNAGRGTSASSGGGRSCATRPGTGPSCEVQGAADGEHPGAHEQPALRVAVVVQAADVMEGAVALAADRAPEDEQHQQAQAARDADVVDRVADGVARQ